MSFLSPVMSAVVSKPTTSTSHLPSDATVTDALQKLRTLSRKEQKSRIKEVKKLLKHYKADKKAGIDTDENTILLAILAILLPPLAIYLKEKELTWKFWLDIALIVFVFVSWGFWLLPVALALLVVFNVL
jgi:uncharacterized membrane protein YqaE (UPF0057 family)